MKKLLPVALIAVSASCFAIDASLTKSAVPRNIILAGIPSSSRLNPLASDFPSGSLNKTKTLLGLDYQTTSYPGNTGETIKMCYYLPYTSTAVGCVDIQPNSSGTVNVFNDKKFGDGVQVEIRHNVTGGTFPGVPAGQDRVTFRYRY